MLLYEGVDSTYFLASLPLVVSIRSQYSLIVTIISALFADEFLALIFQTMGITHPYKEKKCS